MTGLMCSWTLVSLFVHGLAAQSRDRTTLPLAGTDRASFRSVDADRPWVVGSRDRQQQFRPHASHRWGTGGDHMGGRQGDEIMEKNVQVKIDDTRNTEQHSQVNIQDATIVNHHSQVKIQDTTIMDQHLLTNSHTARKDQFSQKRSNQAVHSWETINIQETNNQELNHQQIQHQERHHQEIQHQGLRISSYLECLPLTVWDVAGDSPEVAKIPSRCTLQNNGTKANCAHCNLTEVPSDGIPHNITCLDLQRNLISKLYNYTFANFTQLKYLDLSSNNISELEEVAFYGLNQLQYLSLWGNKLDMSSSTFPTTIFSPLVHLEELRISNNSGSCNTSKGLHYPAEALSRLTSLKSLFMDGLNDAVFGSDFQKLTNLVNVSMLGYIYGCCYLTSLSNETFRHISHIHYLNISSCYLLGKQIQPGAFSHFTNLTVLDLTHDEDIDIQNLDNVFQGLRQIPSLRQLRMNLIANRYSIGICLDTFYIRNFPPHIEHLEAQENNLEGLDRHVLKTLPKSLKTLDVGGNRFVFGTYLRDLHFLTNLTQLKLNGGSFTYSLPSRYPFEVSSRVYTTNCSLYEVMDEDIQDWFILRLPPNLKSVEMKDAGLTYALSKLKVHPDNVLQSLNMRGNKFPKLIGPFVGLNSLASLDLSNSYVREISDSFFDNLASLETLHLNDNLLGDFFSRNKKPRVFLPLVNLKCLDLSFNDIHHFHKNVFAGLDNLQTLLISNNSLSKFHVDISGMKNLTYVNLSRNRIYRLPYVIQQHINLLLGQGLNVTFDLSQCPVSCSCDNFQFLAWMTRSRAFDPKFKNYICVYSDNLSRQITDGYNITIEEMGRKCASNKPLLLCVVASMCIVFSVIVVSVLYRFRWKLRYLYYAAHLFYKSTNADKPRSKFEYDAFISYDAKDEKFVVGKLSRELEKRGLKLCIHGRDFRAGEYIASNIVRAVCDSRRTVVILTHHMVSSYWCGYEIQMANMEAVHTGRQVLIFLLMDNIMTSTLSTELLYHIRNNTYIPYPESLPDATSMGLLWDKLAADIQD